MGPCWLQVKKPVISNNGVRNPTYCQFRTVSNVTSVQISWCKLEVTVKDPKDINPFPETDTTSPKEMPPLTIMSLSVRSIMNHVENKREIVCVSSRIWTNRGSSFISHFFDITTSFQFNSMIQRR
jgi:DNA polymerase alpha subunit A